VCGFVFLNNLFIVYSFKGCVLELGHITYKRRFALGSSFYVLVVQGPVGNKLQAATPLVSLLDFLDRINVVPILQGLCLLLGVSMI
jgi:hypothetical protein